MEDSAKKQLDEEKMVNDAFQHLINTYLASRHRKKVEIITKAFNFAKQAHKGVRRLSGEPYIMHPLAVAQIVCSEIGLGSTSICAALLHDVVEDTDYTVEDVSNIFGPKIAQIVDGLTKISGGIFGDKASAQAESFKKLLLTMSDDIRVILIKISDRLHNMRTLGSQPPNKQYKIAGETLYIYAPLANRLGLNKIKEELERYSVIRTVTAVERADVVVVVIDATEGVTEQDAKIAGIAHERGKGMIIAVNKWDLVEKDNTTMKKFTEKIREKLSYMPYAELIFLSAKTGQRLPKLFEMIDAVIENCALRVQTGVLNEILTEAMAMKQPPSDKGKRLRIYYITQVSVKPPTFVMFINEKKLTHFSYTRYIENQIRTTFGFRGTPIHFIYRERKEK